MSIGRHRRQSTQQAGNNWNKYVNYKKMSSPSDDFNVLETFFRVFWSGDVEILVMEIYGFTLFAEKRAKDKKKETLLWGRKIAEFLLVLTVKFMHFYRWARIMLLALKRNLGCLVLGKTSKTWPETLRTIKLLLSSQKAFILNQKF